MLGNVAAGLVISALLLTGGAAAAGFSLRAAYLAGGDLPLNAEKDVSWVVVGLGCVAGLLLLGGGVALAVYCRGLLAHRVEVRAGGFRYVTRRSADDVRWEEVARVVETVVYERHPVLKFPASMLLPKVASTSYTVVTGSGREYEFDANSVRAIRRFGKVLRAQADRLGLAWETVERHG
jgi:hypothetical protein